MPTEEPLRERLPRYAAAFLAGAALAGVAGTGWGALAGDPIPRTIGWAMVALGVALLLSGGMTGGGFTAASTGDYGVHYGRRHEAGLRSHNAEIGRAQDLRRRLGAGLRPRRNPAAFWQVIAGGAYVGLGVLILETVG